MGGHLGRNALGNYPGVKLSLPASPLASVSPPPAGGCPLGCPLGMAPMAPTAGVNAVWERLVRGWPPMPPPYRPIGVHSRLVFTSKFADNHGMDCL